MNAELVKTGDLVFIDKGRQPVTTSVVVAEVFEKQHKHVLEAIRNLDCSEGFGRTNFRPTSYTDSWNRKQEMCLMTRDGFTFLAMGFTGKKAAEWKEKYIAAFNQMEARLMATRNQAAPVQLVRLHTRLDARVAKIEEMLTRVYGSEYGGGVAGRFCREACVIESGAKTAKLDLYAAYYHWCRGNDIREISLYNTFFRELYRYSSLVRPCSLDRKPAVKGIRLEVNHD